MSAELPKRFHEDNILDIGYGSVIESPTRGKSVLYSEIPEANNIEAYIIDLLSVLRSQTKNPYRGFMGRKSMCRGKVFDDKSQQFREGEFSVDYSIRGEYIFANNVVRVLERLLDQESDPRTINRMINFYQYLLLTGVSDE